MEKFRIQQLNCWTERERENIALSVLNQIISLVWLRYLSRVLLTSKAAAHHLN